MAKKYRVLLVEDEPLIIKILGVRLESEGYIVDRAANGLEAMDLINKNKYSVVLLDLMMPQKNGFEVLAELKAAKNKIPVLAFTNLAQDKDREEVMRLGGNGYYVKADMPLVEMVKIVKNWAEKGKG